MSLTRGLNKPKLFSIGQVHAITGIPKPTIRYWEKEFPQLSPRKNRRGSRLYTTRDIETINKIVRTSRQGGTT